MSNRPASSPGVPDLSWRDDGLFTLFLANTTPGEDAWRVLAAQTDGTGKVFTHHADDVIRQLQAQGYTVARLENHRVSPAELDALLSELEHWPSQP